MQKLVRKIPSFKTFMEVKPPFAQTTWFKIVSALGAVLDNRLISRYHHVYSADKCQTNDAGAEEHNCLKYSSELFPYRLNASVPSRSAPNAARLHLKK